MAATSRSRTSASTGGREEHGPRGARCWRDRIEKSRSGGVVDDHYIEIRYEDLIPDTEPTLRRVCRAHRVALGRRMLDYHERAGERLQEIGGAPPGRPGPPASRRRGAPAGPRDDARGRRTRSGSPLEARDEPEAENAEFEEVAGHLLKELGYETVTPRRSWLAPEEGASVAPSAVPMGRIADPAAPFTVIGGDHPPRAGRSGSNPRGVRHGPRPVWASRLPLGGDSWL